MTGAELRAWRERLGKDEAWGAALLESPRHAPASAEIGCRPGQGLTRLRSAESVADGYAYHVFLRQTLRAALEAEEARQAAERGPVEPVCPEGVKTWAGCGDGAGSANLTMAGQGFASLVVAADGSIRTGQYAPGVPVSPALLEYAAALSRYRASVHADSDKRRKLDAVRAAEEAVGEAHKACEAAHASYRETEALVGRAVGILTTARREAGL